MLLLLLKHPNVAALAVAVGLLLGLICSSDASLQLKDNMRTLEGLRKTYLQSMELRLIEDGQAGLYGQTVDAETHIDGKRIVFRVQTKASEPLFFGESIKGRCSLKEVKEDKAGRFWNEGIAGFVSIGETEISDGGSLLAPICQLRKQIVMSIESQSDVDDAKAVLEALVCGYKTNLYDSEVYPRFQQCGLAHMVAVSGAHLGIIGGLMASLCASAGLSRRKSALLQGTFLSVYLVLAAIPVSGIRATLMACCVLLSVFSRRRASSLNALGICLVVMLVQDPRQALSTSFCLSAGSTLGIILLSSLVNGWLFEMARRVPKAIRDILSVTIAANIASLPYSVALFSQLPLIGIVSNVIAAPLFTIVCAGGMICAVLSTLIPGLVSLTWFVGFALSRILCSVVHVVSLAPGGCIAATMYPLLAVGLSVLLMISIWIWWPKPSKIGGYGLLSCLFLACSLIGLLGSHPFETEIIMLDVGQGDCFVIRSGGRQVMIDTGNQPMKLKQALARNGIRHLDALIISHADDDHCGCISELKQVVDVDAVYAAADTLSCSCDSCESLRSGCPELQPLAYGSEITCGNVNMRVVWPISFENEGGNSDSLCLLAESDIDRDGDVDQTALFCGDAEHEQLRQMLEQVPQLHGVTLYKVGHHGSKNALDDQVVRELRPAIALVSVGESNRYGHPADETLRRLGAVGSRTYRTDTQGDVVCRLSADGVRVKTLR